MAVVLVGVLGAFDAPPALAAVRESNRVVAWGDGVGFGGRRTPPEGLNGVTAIAAGAYFGVALKRDGTVVAWGDDTDGESTPPAGLTGVTAITAGRYHSLALKNDGTVVSWGWNYYGQTDVPAGLTGVIGIAAGERFSLALKSDGTVVGWGYYAEAEVPSDLSGVTAIAASFYGGLALKSDGTVFCWGLGGGDVPAGLSGVTAIDAGLGHYLALKSDGTVVAWGLNNNGQSFTGQANVPTGLTGVTAISAGSFHSLALKGNGTVVGWGESIPPAGLSGVTAISGGEHYSLAITGAPILNADTPPANATAGTTYEYDFGSTGAPAPTFALGSGKLPAGLSLSPSGLLYGTPTTAGSFTFTVAATNSAGTVTSGSRTITVAPGAADTVTATSGGSQTAAAGAKFGAPLVATVTDANANPVSGVPVTFTLPAASATTGSATFPGGATTATVTSQANGTATSPAISGGQAGGVTATATIPGGASTAFSLAVTATGPAKADLAVSIAVPAKTVRGGTATEKVTVTNGGPASAAKVGTAVLVPRGWSVTNTGGGRLVGSRVVVFGIASLASGANTSYTLTLRADGSKGTQITAAGTVSGTADPNLRNNLTAAGVTIN